MIRAVKGSQRVDRKRRWMSLRSRIRIRCGGVIFGPTSSRPPPHPRHLSWLPQDSWHLQPPASALVCQADRPDVSKTKIPFLISVNTKRQFSSATSFQTELAYLPSPCLGAAQLRARNGRKLEVAAWDDSFLSLRSRVTRLTRTLLKATFTVCGNVIIRPRRLPNLDMYITINHRFFCAYSTLVQSHESHNA